MSQFLKVGDVFKLEKGMKVYARIPECFRFANRPLSRGYTEGEVVVGETLRVRTVGKLDLEKTVKGLVERGEWDTGLKLDPAKVRSLVLSTAKAQGISVPKILDTSSFIGEYVVEKAHSEGGGTGMGPNDVYPDGWRVTARQLTKEGKYNADGRVISFYQSGCFTAMIEPDKVQSIRKLKQSFA